VSHLAALLLSVLGFGALALAMDRHQRSVFSHRLTTATTLCLRWGGWSALAVALLAAVQGQGGIGLVSFSGHTSIAAGLVYASLVANERRKIVQR
jgi:hypothetical protein